MEGTQSTAIRFVQANSFELRSGRVIITYAASSLTGEPRLTYQDRNMRLAFAGDAIRTQSTEIGTMITVTLESIPDLRVVTLTLILPLVNLEEPSLAAPVRLPALRATHFTTIAGPGPGQETIYQTLEMAGMARHLVF